MTDNLRLKREALGVPGLGGILAGLNQLDLSEKCMDSIRAGQLPTRIYFARIIKVGYYLLCYLIKY
jgi:hypothetical protein